MKYIKKYENNVLDNILDKISKYGMKSITSTEKEYLEKYYDGDVSEIEKELIGRRNRVSSLWEYDPREDKEFFGELSDETGFNFDFDIYDDDMIEQGRYSIMWDECEDEDIDHFVEVFNVTDAKNSKGDYFGWEMLSDETREKFKQYIKELY